MSPLQSSAAPSMLRDLKLGTRVRAGFGAVIAMIVAMAVLGLVLIASQQRHATALHAHRLLPLQRLALISDAYADATIRSQLATADREWRAYTARPAEGAVRARVDWQVRAAAQDADRDHPPRRDRRARGHRTRDHPGLDRRCPGLGREPVARRWEQLGGGDAAGDLRSPAGARHAHAGERLERGPGARVHGADPRLHEGGGRADGRPLDGHRGDPRQRRGHGEDPPDHRGDRVPDEPPRPERRRGGRARRRRGPRVRRRRRRGACPRAAERGIRAADRGTHRPFAREFRTWSGAQRAGAFAARRRERPGGRGRVRDGGDRGGGRGALGPGAESMAEPTTATSARERSARRARRSSVAIARRDLAARARVAIPFGDETLSEF